MNNRFPSNYPALDNKNGQRNEVKVEDIESQNESIREIVREEFSILQKDLSRKEIYSSENGEVYKYKDTGKSKFYFNGNFDKSELKLIVNKLNKYL